MENVKRLASGLIAFALVLVLLAIKNKYLVDVVLAVVAIFAIEEYFKAVSKVCKPIKWVGYISAISVALVHIIPKEYLGLTVALSIPTILLVLFLQVILTTMKTTFKDVAYTFLGIFYIVFFTMFISVIYGMENGNILIWYTFFAAWGTDIFAYYFGCKFGKHKLNKISPKKSIEGSIAGIIGSTLLALVFTYFVNTYGGMNFNYIIVGIVGAVLSILGQIGDFSASSIKRYVDIKDYSNLIPGHGGMLDRIDSLLFIAPFAYAFFEILL